MDYSLMNQWGQGGGMGLTAPSTWANFQAPNFQLPQNIAAGGMGGFGSGLGFNMPTAQLGLGMINSLGSLFGSFQANKLAKDQFNFTKEMTNMNANNQIKSYNTALEDRARTRAFTEGRDQSTADAWVDKNKMTR